MLKRFLNKRYFYLVGSGAGVLGILFVASTLISYWDNLPLSALTVWDWGRLVALTLVSGASGLLLADAWRRLLAHFGVVVTPGWAAHAYGISQLARYLPGNVCHLAGRQAIGAGAGVENIPLIKSALFELGTISITAAVVTLLLFLVGIVENALFATAVIVVTCALLLYWALRRKGSQVAIAALVYAAYLIVAGLIFIGVVLIFASEPQQVRADLTTVCGAYVLAWLAGLLTPGAPAGIGVREFVLLTVLTQVPVPELIASVVAVRSVTAVGDLLFYFYALSIRDAAVRVS